jgi:hypothetical protein
MAPALRARVLALYRTALRSARRCPTAEKRAEMAAYARCGGTVGGACYARALRPARATSARVTRRLRFRDNALHRDAGVVVRLLRLGEEEVAQMEGYHAARAGPQPPSAGPEPACSACGTPFPSTTSRFCAECGHRRRVS